MTKPLIHHYGLHQEAGLVYMHQHPDGSGECWEYETESPFLAKVVGGKPPHFFLKNPHLSWKEMKHIKLLKKNPLLSAMVPQVLEGRARLLLVPVEDSFRDVTFILNMLDFCCSVNGGGFRVFDGKQGDVASIAKRLTATNLIPFVLSNMKLKDHTVVEELLHHMFQSKRNMICLVPRNFPPILGTEWISEDVLTEAKQFVDKNNQTSFPVYGSSYLIDNVITPLQEKYAEEIHESDSESIEDPA